MKKIYLSPTIETNQLNFSYMICGEGSEGGGNITGGGGMFAPKRETQNPF